MQRKHLEQWAVSCVCVSLRKMPEQSIYKHPHQCLGTADGEPPKLTPAQQGFAEILRLSKQCFVLFPFVLFLFYFLKLAMFSGVKNLMFGNRG